MTTKHTYISLVTLMIGVVGFLSLAMPAAAFTEGSVDRESFSIPELGVGVYMLTIVIGGWSEDLYLPVMGERSMPYGTRENRFGFTLEPGYPGTDAEVGTVTALMTAGFPIEDGYYKIPARTFTSVRVIALADVGEEDGNTYRFKITNLPFLSGEEKEPGHFTNGEMKYLHTSYEPLHFERDKE